MVQDLEAKEDVVIPQHQTLPQKTIALGNKYPKMSFKHKEIKQMYENV